MFEIELLILNFTLLKHLIFWLNQLHVNHKSHVSQPTIIMYHMKVLKTLRFYFACSYLRVFDSHSSAFLFHLFIQQLH